MGTLVTALEAGHEFIAQVSVRFKPYPGVTSRHNEWLSSEEAKGFYTRAFRDFEDAEYVEMTIYFTDPDTAFEFKMRFG